ncbi:MAG: hypothetical protein AAGC55_17110 [Myxococcota bacterium]
MRRAIASWAALGAIAMVLLAGCPESQSTRCKALCQQQLACIDLLDRDELAFDQNECTMACSSLDRSGDGKKKIDFYAACVEQAGDDCAAVVRCIEQGAEP